MSIDRMSLNWFAKRSALTSITLLIGDVSLYVAMVAGTIVSDVIWLKLLFAIGAGTMIALTAIVGHDAGHQSFSNSKRLNRICGTIAFLPALHPFSLWEHHHNRVHHKFTAQLGIDNAFPPMTVEDYKRALPWQKAKYRFLRSLWGQPFFYLVDVWAKNLIIPFASRNANLSPRDWFDLALVYAYIPVFLGLATYATWSINSGDLLQAFASTFWFSFIIPFLVWNAFISFLSIVQHTAPQLRWVNPTGKPSTPEQALAGTVHVLFPEWIDKLMHRIMQHQAHHLNVGIPLQHLKSAQENVAATNSGILTVRWSPQYHVELTRQCQLYDNKNHRWCTFKEAEIDSEGWMRAA